MLWSAFTLGLFGSLHCLGMCGPIALALPLTKKERLAVVLQSFLYNIGRVFSYTFLGLILGLLGWGVAIAGYQKSLSIVLGIILIISAFFSISIENKLLRFGPFQRAYSKVKSKLSSLIRKNSFSNIFKLGFVNGLLPCGMVYVALAGALASGSTGQGALYMTLFGLGTLPMMMGVMLIGNFNKSFFLKLRKWIPLIMLAFGIMLIRRGLALEVPLDIKFWEANNFPVMCH